MNDDLRQLVTEELPILAHQIAHTGLSLMPLFKGYRGRPEGIDFARRMGFGGFSPTFVDYERPFYHEKTLVMAGRHGGGVGYRFVGRNYEGLANPWSGSYMIFHDLRLKDITNVEVGTLDVADVDSKSKVITLDSYQNDGPRDFRRRTETEKETETSHEKSFGWMVGTEFRMRMTRRVGVSMEVFEAGGELEIELSARAEQRGDEEWRQSDRQRETVENEYYVSPYHDWTLTTERSVKNIKQDVLVTGTLECKIAVNMPGWGFHIFDSIEKAKEAFTGYNPGAGFIGEWFSDPERFVDPKTVEDWNQPAITLNCPIEGQRTRYSKAISKQTVIPGREKLLEATSEDDGGFDFPDLNLSDDEDEGEEDYDQAFVDGDQQPGEEISDDELDDFEALHKKRKKKKKGKKKKKNQGVDHDVE